ncbi:MAG: CinA family protein [Cycloclasticus sp.]|nr:CinA family protein [Cycloclasticus sp.]
MVESMGEEITLLTEKLSMLLIEQNKTLAVAESCTGGWLSKVLTDLSGSSQWFLGGVVSYSNESKQGLINVEKKHLDQCGAVSKEVAEQMAEGVEKAFMSSISVSITGVAGPSGGTPDKPVGLVWFGIKAPSAEAYSIRKTFVGSRDQVRQQAVLTALTLLLKDLAK